MSFGKDITCGIVTVNNRSEFNVILADKSVKSVILIARNKLSVFGYGFNIARFVVNIIPDFLFNVNIKIYKPMAAKICRHCLLFTFKYHNFVIFWRI